MGYHHIFLCISKEFLSTTLISLGRRVGVKIPCLMAADWQLGLTANEHEREDEVNLRDILSSMREVIDEGLAERCASSKPKHLGILSIQSTLRRLGLLSLIYSSQGGTC
jgi:hypothetical protein